MSKRNHESGFTLVELTVALALMSLIALVLVGAYRGIAQVADRFDNWQEAIEDQRLLVLTVTELLGLGYLPPSSAGKDRIFHPAADQLIWVGVMPPRHSRGGRYVFRLAVEPSENGRPSRLVLRYTPWLGRSPDWVASESQTVLVGVQSLRFSYLRGGVLWKVGESDAAGGPDRVQMSVQTATGSVLPLFVFQFRAMKRLSAASFGGGSSR